jgi:hypothetical protein
MQTRANGGLPISGRSARIVKIWVAQVAHSLDYRRVVWRAALANPFV